MKKNVTATVTVVGAGVAGLAASCALAGAGYEVTLLEQRPFVGGRASSYEHPALHEVVDCQHVLLGCCTNLIHLLEDSGVAGAVRWYDEFVFLEQGGLERGGRRSLFRANGLPAPLHFSGAFLRAAMLDARDKLAIARGMSEFLSANEQDDAVSAEQWLARTKQTPRAIRHFWEPVLLCTLNDNSANCSMKIAGKVFRELFLKSPLGAKFGIPTVPLSELYSGAARRFESLGGTVRLRTAVDAICADGDRWTLQTSTGTQTSDAVVLALPFEQAQKLISRLPKSEAAAALEDDVARFVHSPYTTIHLWFDRQITDLHHAALLDTTIQWVFHKSRIRRYPDAQGSYVELVIAASTAQLKMDRSAILKAALDELASFFPEVTRATLLKSGILKEARATFSVLPGLDRFRPFPNSPWPSLYLAGDWTATGWPATMEGAARSGYLAAEAVARDHGEARSFLQPDLVASGLMKS